MDSDELTHLQRLCRVCMASAMDDYATDMYNIQSNSNQPTLRAMLGLVCSAVFSGEFGDQQEFGMPHRVCTVCERAIVDAYGLHQRCLETDRKLRQLMVVKQEPFTDETGFFEKITADPIVDFCVDDGGIKLEELHFEDDESEEELEREVLPTERQRLLKKSESSTRTVSCGNCSKQFTTTAAVKRHIRESHCNKQSSAGLTENKIERKNSEQTASQKSWPCNFCSEIFKTKARLEKHMEQDHSDRIFRCDVCRKMFSSEEQYEDHRQFHITGKRFGCKYCYKRFTFKNGLKAHIGIHSDAEPLPCPECGKRFQNVQSLRHHVSIHNQKERRFQCEQCPVKFNSAAKLKAHMLTHTKERNHVCEICGSRFTVAVSLQTHMKSVHGERTFACNTCNLKFSCSNHLIRHTRIHTGEKPYTCAYCDRAYAQSNDLVKHCRIHVGDKPYACDRCQESFRLVTELRNHYKVHFGDGDNDEARAMFGEIENKAIFSITAILKRRFEAEKLQRQES